MATRAVVYELIKPHGDHAHIATWSGLLNGDDGTPCEMIGASDRSIQVEGTFGAGGTVLIEGTNDGTNWRTLTDPQGNALSFTAAKIEAVLELVKKIRPRVSAGDGTTNLVVTMLLRNPRLI